MAAWAGSLPFLLWSYNLVTPVSLLANLLVVPVAFLILAGALLSILAAPLSLAVAIIFNNANWVLAKLVLAIVQLFAQLPLGHFYAERLPQVVAPLAEVTVLDVGRGAAVHLRSHGRDWLFDAGSERDFGRVLQPYLHSRGVNRLDGLLLTHGDAAHIGGAAGLVRIFRPRIIIDNAARDHSRTHRALIEELGSRHLLRSLAAAGAGVILEPDIKARILFPPRGFAAKTADDQALVVQLVVRGRPKVLFLSDGGGLTERALLAEQQSALAAPILVKGQHWSGVSGSAAFLDAVRPKIIIATARDFPNSEHIADDWAAMVRKRGIKLFRQDETGAVTLRFYRDHWDAKSYLPSETFRSSNR
jgi:beta-lactamase superfamily II metal-dependent hydrolase